MRTTFPTAFVLWLLFVSPTVLQFSAIDLRRFNLTLCPSLRQHSMTLLSIYWAKKRAHYANPTLLRRCFDARGTSFSYGACIYKHYMKNYRSDTFNPRIGILGVDLYEKRFWIFQIGWKLTKIAYLEGFQWAENKKTRFLKAFKKNSNFFGPIRWSNAKFRGYVFFNFSPYLTV